MLIHRFLFSHLVCHMVLITYHVFVLDKVEALFGGDLKHYGP